jgi:hypothetical protein
VFMTNSEAGPVALLVVGLVLVLVGMSGRLPNRLKLGDNEAEWIEAVGAAFDAVIDEVPPANLPKVEEAIKDLADAAPAVAQRARQGLETEKLLLSRLAESVERLRLIIARELPVGPPTPDAIVIDRKGRKLWVIAHNGRFRGWEYAAAQQLVARLKADDEGFVGVLVLASAERNHQERIDGPAGTVWVATVGGNHGRDEISAALAEAFGL